MKQLLFGNGGCVVFNNGVIFHFAPKTFLKGDQTTVFMTDLGEVYRYLVRRGFPFEHVSSSSLVYDEISKILRQHSVFWMGGTVLCALVQDPEEPKTYISAVRDLGFAIRDLLIYLEILPMDLPGGKRGWDTRY